MTESTSAELAPEVRVRVRTGSPLSEVFLIDHSFALVSRSVGDLETTVAPGVYKVKATLADALTSPTGEEPAVEYAAESHCAHARRHRAQLRPRASQDHADDHHAGGRV